MGLQYFNHAHPLWHHWRWAKQKNLIFYSLNIWVPPGGNIHISYNTGKKKGVRNSNQFYWAAAFWWKRCENAFCFVWTGALSSLKNHLLIAHFYHKCCFHYNFSSPYYCKFFTYMLIPNYRWQVFPSVHLSEPFVIEIQYNPQSDVLQLNLILWWVWHLTTI